MKKVVSFLGVAILVILFFIIISPKDKTNTNSNNQKATTIMTKQNEVNSYLSKYSGAYQIEVRGYNSQSDVEAYALHNNGNAKWMLIMAQPGGQARLVSEKSGTWTATANKITIRINGNSGPIIEEYTLINGRFTLGDRSLKRTE